MHSLAALKGNYCHLLLEEEEEEEEEEVEMEENEDGTGKKDK